MKKTFILLIVTAFTLSMFAEDIPAGYYDAIDGKQDSVLKSTLSQIVCGGIRYEYGANQYHSSSNPPEWEKGDLKAYGTWQAFPVTDISDYNVILDMYSKSVRYFPNKRGESGSGLQIEHCLPKSWWGWTNKDTRDTSLMAYKDLYNLNPADAQANGQKSNYAPGHVVKGDKFDNGSFRMDKAASSTYKYICFEPEEQFRGDFARAYFYIVTAYEGLEWSSTYTQYVNKDSYLMFSDNITSVLLDWHRADPVSDKEICRADQISSIQHNRNPYIDYPELVEYIWGNKRGMSVDLSALTCTEGTGVCPEPLQPTPEPQIYDTIINLPGLTKALVNDYKNGDITGFASDKIQSNGTYSITMGASSTDGYLSFNHLNLKDSAILSFRASPFQTANSMQLDIYAGTTKIQTIAETVVQNTRNEIRYKVVIPAGTDSITIASVGGATTKRASMQELYLLSPKDDPTGIDAPNTIPAARKVLRDGQIIILRNESEYTITGQTIR